MHTYLYTYIPSCLHTYIQTRLCPYLQESRQTDGETDQADSQIRQTADQTEQTDRSGETEVQRD